MSETEQQKQVKRANIKIGRIVSDKMEKSVVVAVDRLVEHPLYRKTIRRTNTFMAHDEDNACSIGDKVKIQETRPLSRHKRWKVMEILEKAKR